MPVLRAILVTAGVLALVGVPVSVFCGAPFPIPLWLAGGGIVLLLGSLYERIHYKRLAGASPGPDWEATAERFVDPETGKLVQVYLKPRTGERTYVVIGDPPAKTPDPS